MLGREPKDDPPAGPFGAAKGSISDHCEPDICRRRYGEWIGASSLKRALGSFHQGVQILGTEGRQFFSGTYEHDAPFL